MRGRSYPVGLLLGLAGAIFAAPSPGADVVSSSVEQLAVVNHGVGGPVVNAAGDKLDFNGAHFFGRDQEQHDFNRQAHVNLELVRNVDPHLRRFLGKSIVKREGPYPPAVWPPTHYEPPTSPPPATTTTTTTEAPPTTPPVVPHEVYGLPPGEPVPVPCVPKSWGEGSDCVPTEYLPLSPVVDLPVVDLPVVDLPVVPPLVLCTGEDVSGNNLQEPAKTTLYELSEIVGNLFGEGEEQEAPGTNGDTAPSDGPSQSPQLPEPTDTDGNTSPSEGLSSCTDCTFSQLPELPALVYPSLPPSPPTATVSPQPVPQVPDCHRTVFVKTYPATEPYRNAEKTAPREQHDEAELVDLRQGENKKQKSNVLSTQSQLILVRDMEPYPVLKAKTDRTPASRQTKLEQRGPIRYVHTFKKVNKGLKADQVDELDGLQPVEGTQFVLCTVDCYALEEKVRAPETPAMEIPSDGRLW